MKNYKNFIGGQWMSAVSDETFLDRNPADRRDILGTMPRSGSPDIGRAVQSAKKAMPDWAATPAPKRAEILFRSARILEDRKEELASVMTREMGKLLRESHADVQEAIDTAYFFAGEGRRLYGQTVPSELRNKMCLTLRRPVGVCGLITPWNFPLAIPACKVYPALICGNTVVLKPAEDTPLMSLLFAEILADAGLPAGVMNVVTGFGKEAGAPLAQHKDISLVSFTGSSEVGSGIASACGKLLKRCSLEMGGKNAQIVMEDADLDLAVTAALWGAFATSGQRCTATSRIILHEKIYNRFLKAFLKAAKSFKIGPGAVPSTDLGPIINQNQLVRIDRHVKKAKKEGARLLLGGRIDKAGEKRYGHFYCPTVFAGVSPGMSLAQEEIFGPVVGFFKVKSLEEAIRIINDSSYGLSSSVFTKNIPRAMKSIEEIESGITYINSSTIGAEAH